jgi:hypothetical protein
MIRLNNLNVANSKYYPCFSGFFLQFINCSINKIMSILSLFIIARTPQIINNIINWLVRVTSWSRLFRLFGCVNSFVRIMPKIKESTSSHLGG